MPRSISGFRPSSLAGRARASLAVLTVALASAATPALAQPDVRGMGGGIGISVWSDAGYRGNNATFRNDVRDLRSAGIDNAISSIRVAANEQWEICEFPDYRGRCQVVHGEEPDLKPRSWNDLVSSMRRVRGGGGGAGGVRPPVAGIGSVTLFPNRDFQGAQRIFRQASPLLTTSARQAYSARVVGTWMLCGGANFQQCRAVSGDVPNLSQLGLAGRLLSLRPASANGGASPGDDAGDYRFVAYASDAYRGASQTLSGNASYLNGFRSAQVSGHWLVCDQSEFRGQCRTLTASVRDVRQLGLDAIRSARPLR